MKTSTPPHRLELSASGRTVTYTLDRSQHAVVDGERFEIVAGEPAARQAGDVAPVYTMGESGMVAVPTGKVLVRMAEGCRIGDCADALAEAGFAVDRPIAYAPHAAWVRPVRGGIAAALQGLDRLAQAKGIEHVEPQMLMPAGRKARLD